MQQYAGKGDVKKTLENSLNVANTHYLDIFTIWEDYIQGIYLVRTQTETTPKTIKVM